MRNPVTGRNRKNPPGPVPVPHRRCVAPEDSEGPEDRQVPVWPHCQEERCLAEKENAPEESPFSPGVKDRLQINIAGNQDENYEDLRRSRQAV